MQSGQNRYCAPGVYVVREIQPNKLEAALAIVRKASERIAYLSEPNSAEGGQRLGTGAEGASRRGGPERLRGASGGARGRPVVPNRGGAALRGASAARRIFPAGIVRRAGLGPA